MPVPFVDLARLHASIGDDLSAAFDEVVRTSAFIGGAALEAFETELAAAHRAPAAAGCASGTDALVLALRALGIGPGDEVIVPSMTFVADVEAVVHAGATPVIADVDPATLLLTPETVDAVRTAATRAVAPVHLYGHVVPFAALRQWRADGLLVVEDAAQAHLAADGDELVGAAGDMTTFSFYPGKNLGALGDGGAVMAHDVALVERVRKLRDHGRTEKYEHDEIGWFSRLDGLQAALLRTKLRRLSAWTDARRHLAGRYRERLGRWLVPWSSGAVHHLIVARVAAADRDAVREKLRAAGIGTGVHYPVPLSRQPSCRPWARSCPAAEAAADEILSLPIDPLMSVDDVDEVCDRFLEVAE